MKKIITTILLSIFLLQVPIASAVTSCSTSVDEHIAEVIEGKKGFIEKLSQALMSEQKKELALDESIKDFRELVCDLERICKAIDVSYENAALISKEQPPVLDYQCKHYQDKNLSKPYTREDFIGENAICAFNAKDLSGYETEKEECYKKISIAQLNAETLIKVGYSQASEQDEANYYSAKILSIVGRLKTLGDMFQSLNDNIRKVFEKISCRCSR